MTALSIRSSRSRQRRDARWLVIVLPAMPLRIIFGVSPNAFPDVSIILYHTYLGPPEGRRRAAKHVHEQPNLYLESSWCQWRTVLGLIEEVGDDRLLFGSDASIDGMAHYTPDPPNVEGCETYNEGLIPLVRKLGVERAGELLGDNARRLFGLNGNSHGE
jgi:predicted TIM-barrel fold metal-dependent hydrolase